MIIRISIHKIIKFYLFCFSDFFKARPFFVVTTTSITTTKYLTLTNWNKNSTYLHQTQKIVFFYFFALKRIFESSSINKIKQQQKKQSADLSVIHIKPEKKPLALFSLIYKIFVLFLNIHLQKK